LAFFINRRPPTVTTANQTVSPPVATASASSLVPVPQLSIPAPAATASASGPLPVPQVQVPPAAATASASAPTPVPQLGIIVPLATASANGPPPLVPAIVVPTATASASSQPAGHATPAIRLFPGVATSTASAPTPTVQIGISVPAATATASSPAPALPIKAPTASASASSIAPTMPIKVTGSVTWVGYSPQEVFPDAPSIERDIGRRFDGVRKNLNLDNSASGFDTDVGLGYLKNYRNANAQYVDGGGVKQAMPWDEVAAGLWDTEIDALITDILTETWCNPTNPMRFSFHHEQTVANSNQKGYLAVPTNTQQAYIDAYRHVRDKFDAAGATVRSKTGQYLGGKVTFVYCVLPDMWVSPTTPGLTVDDFDPDKGTSPAPAGTSYYEEFATDFYQNVVSGHIKYGTNASTIFADFLTLANARGKDFLFPEFGAGDDGLNSTVSQEIADFLDAFGTYIKGLPITGSRLKWIGFTVGSGGVPSSLYYPASSPLKLAAFQRLVRDPYFYNDDATTFSGIPGIDVKVVVPAATASASSPLPAVQLRVSPAAATASASALVPTVIGSQIISPPAATASVSSPVPTIQLRVSPAAATASASAFVPTITVAAVVSPPVATANASAPTPVVDVKVSPAAATASVSGLVPTLQLRVSPAAATATASAALPTPQDRLTPPAATANASAPVPTIQVRVLPPAAVANASAPIPTISGVIDQIVMPPVATASASAKVPGIGVVPPKATATAFAPVPNIRVVMIQWPSHSGNQWPPDTNIKWGPRTNPQWNKIPALQWPPDSNERW